MRVLRSYLAVNTPRVSYEDHRFCAVKVNVAAYLIECGKQIVALWGICSVVSVMLMFYTGMRRITTFRSTTDRIYDGGPIIS